jgi:hypothetical protein
MPFYLAIYNFTDPNPIIAYPIESFLEALERYFQVKDIRSEDDVNIMLYTSGGNIIYGF